MIYNSNAARTYLANHKNEYIAKMEAYIRMNNGIICLLERFKKVIASFDGKVYNKRLINALQKELVSVDGGKYQDCAVTVPQSKDKMFELMMNGDWREFRIDGKFGGYLSLSSEYVKVVMSEDENDRINAARVNERIDNAVFIRKEAANRYVDAIENFDKYCDMSIEIEKKLNEYWNTVPSCLRLDITMRTPLDF